MAYLYRHIRLDKNQPFYIGVGGLNKFDDYARAFYKTRRSIYWKRIVNLTDYRVEIILDELSPEEAFIKEKEFIKLYKEHFNSLCNLTEGGDGIVGYIFTEEDRRKIGIKSKGRKFLPRSEELKIHMSIIAKKNKVGGRNKKKIIQLSKTDEYIRTWDSISEASLYINSSTGAISDVLANKRRTCKGYKWKYETM